MSNEMVVVRKLKFDGSVRYEWDGDMVAELDGWAVVLHNPNRHEKRQAKAPVEDGSGGFGLHYLGFDEPVTVLFWFDERGRFVDAKCDAAYPAVRADDRMDFIDLDLDVIVLPGLQHYVRDQEVFAERSVTMAYSEEAKRIAHLGILHSLRMVRRELFPFDGHADELAQLVLSGTARRK
ncbi:MAG: DUF402 domain-containing protein [Dehalococcoidia bacterium]